MVRTMVNCMTFIFAAALLSTTAVGQARMLTADGQSAAYTRIKSVLYSSPETPDCAHPEFGPHITYEIDPFLKKYVFVFNMHVTPDNDRCSAFDRQRLEIKTEGNKSTPDYLKGFIGDTVTYRWLFKLPEGFQPSTSFTHIHQIKAYDGDAGSPLITITPRKASPNRLELIHINSSGTTTKVANTPLAPFLGHWVEGYEKITYGYNGQYSLVLTNAEDGTVLFTYSNDNLDLWRKGTITIRPKWGIYRSLDHPEQLRDEQVLFDRFCLAKGADGCESIQDSPEFALAITPSFATVAGGGTAKFNVSTSALRGFVGDVALSVKGLPTGATAQFTPATISGGEGSAELEIATAAGTPVGDYSLVVSGISGILSHAAIAPLSTTLDSTPPVTVVQTSPVPNAAGWNNSDVVVLLTASDDAAGAGVNRITYSMSGAQEVPPTDVPGDKASLSINVEGTTTIMFFAIDNAGNIESPKRIVVSLDKTIPIVTCSAMPNVIWPPNHKFVPVEVAVNVSDFGSGSAGFSLSSVLSNEADSGSGDVQDFLVGAPSTAGLLRAERLGTGTGRFYTFAYTGSDRAGNSAICTADVVVPHDQGR